MQYTFNSKLNNRILMFVLVASLATTTRSVYVSILQYTYRRDGAVHWKEYWKEEKAIRCWEYKNTSTILEYNTTK